MTLSEFADFVNGISGERPSSMRLGQWAFCLLHESYPEIAKEIQFTNSDPFDHDKRMPVFLKRVLDFVTP